LETGRLFGWELEYVLMFLPATAISLGSMSIPTIGLHVVEITSYTKCDMPSVASNIQDIFVFKPFTPKRTQTQIFAIRIAIAIIPRILRNLEIRKT
jgi:hypothetical protein